MSRMCEVESWEQNGYTVEIYQDDDAQSPDHWDNNELFLITTSNRYFEVSRKGFDMDSARDGKYKRDYNIVPLYAYIHSGVSLSIDRRGCFSDPWDSGHIGFVFVKKRAGFRDIQKAAQSLVEEWNMYLAGDVWGYVIERNGEQVDSLWGMYGIDYARERAKEAVPVQAR